MIVQHFLHLASPIAHGLGFVVLNSVLPIYATSDRGLAVNTQQWAVIQTYRMVGKCFTGFLVAPMIHAFSLHQVNAWSIIIAGTVGIENSIMLFLFHILRCF